MRYYNIFIVNFPFFCSYPFFLPSIIYILILLRKSLMQPLFYSQNTAFRIPEEVQKQIQMAQISREFLLLAFINEQYMLTQHLIQNQFKLSEELKKQKQSSDSGQSSIPLNLNVNKRSQRSEEQDFKFPSQNMDDLSSGNTEKNQQPLTRLRVRKVFKYQIDSESENEKKYKVCETKNIIKNYIKSILNFIKKNKKQMEKIIEKFGVNESELMQEANELNGKVNTIVQLRQFWTEKKFSKIYRIVSSYFLRKCSFHHIFYSRISNYQIHLKYRHKLLMSLKRPQQFSSLKNF